MHACRAVEIGESALQRGAILQHVTGSGGTAQVVLQYQVFSLAITDQVGAADVDIDVLGDIESHEFPAEMFCSQNIVGRDDPILEDLLVMINIVKEVIQRSDALDKTFLDHLPLAVGNDPRHQIEGEDPLGPLIVVVDGEGDPASHEGEIHGRLLAPVFRLVKQLEAISDFAVVGPHRRLVGEHFVKKVFWFVSVEEHGVCG